MVPARVELSTERLRLVPYADEHLDALSELNADPEVMRYITGKPQTRAETQAIIERVKMRWETWGYSWWTIFERQSSEIVGAGCIQNLRREGTEPDLTCPLEIGWRIRRDKWGRGFATEAAHAMAEFAFTRLSADGLLAVCHSENGASIGVMVKLGMHFRGLEDWYSQKVTTFEITAEEWRRSRSKVTRPPGPS